jgi:PBSX family phage terminase large subunit
LENPDRVRGLTLSACGVDEATDLEESDWMLLLGRVSVKLPDKPLQLFGACNPKAPGHWLAQRFGIVRDRVDKSRAVPGCSAYLTNAFENPFLSEEYKAVLRSYTGIRYQRDVMGAWVSVEGAVYPNWSQTNIRKRPEEFSRYIIACDYGFTDPFVALHIGLDPDRRMHVGSEFVRPRMQTEEQVAAVEKLYIKHPCDYIVVDSAAASLVEALRIAGLPARGAKKGRYEGVEKVRSRLNDPGDGLPRLTVDPSCKTLIEEMEGYEYEPGTEEPRDGKDHCLDALRYAVMAVDRGAIPIVLPDLPAQSVAPAKEHVLFPEKKEAAVDYMERMRKDPDFGFERPRIYRGYGRGSLSG